MLEPAAVPPAVEGEDRRPPIILLRLAFDDPLGDRSCDDALDGAAAEGHGVGPLRREFRVGGEGPGRHFLSPLQLCDVAGVLCEVAAVQAGWLQMTTRMQLALVPCLCCSFTR